MKRWDNFLTGPHQPWKDLVKHDYYNRKLRLSPLFSILGKNSKSRSSTILIQLHLSCNGESSAFWEYIWADNVDFKSAFPTAYWLAYDKTCTVDMFMSKIDITENFRQPLPQQAISEILVLQSHPETISLFGERVKRYWKWFTNNKFTVLARYNF